MEKVSFRITDDQKKQVEELAKQKYPNKSELLREALRDFLEEKTSSDGKRDKDLDSWRSSR